MLFHQKSNPAASKFHRELGYRCPSRQLRQDVGVGLAAAAFGIIAGLAGAVTLFPRPSSDLARSESALAMIPPGPVIPASPVRDSAPPTVLIAPRAQAGVIGRSRGGDIAKELPPAAPTRQTVEAAPAAPPPVQTPAQAVPAVTSDRGMVQAGVPGQSRPVSRKGARTVNSSVRRHAREPNPRAAFATSPVGFQADPYADHARNGRRRASGGDWSW
jgi:hypothetical protein